MLFPFAFAATLFAGVIGQFISLGFHVPVFSGDLVSENSVSELLKVFP